MHYVKLVGAEAVKCVEKLKVFSALGETESQEKENSISKVVDAHSQWLSGDQSEACYRKGVILVMSAVACFWCLSCSLESVQQCRPPIVSSNSLLSSSLSSSTHSLSTVAPSLWSLSLQAGQL